MDAERIMFTKMLRRVGALPLAEAADEIAEMGFDGADLTVRPGGYVEPEEASDRLPDALDLLHDRGLSVPLLTTAITSADDAGAEAILDAAAAGGVEYVKLGYWRYDGFGTRGDGLAEMRADLDGIVDLTRSYPVKPVVHVHSGDYLTADAATLAETLCAYDPEEVGAYADPAHMTLEGGKGGWKQGLDALGEYVALSSVKNFGWVQELSPETNGTEWRSRMFSVEGGLTPWPEVIDCLDDLGVDGPLSVHSEYGEFDFDALLAQTREDLAYVDSLLDR